MILNTLETADPTSAWYVGKVRHVRHQPVTHRFDYSMMMGLFDLDELERLDAGVRGFGVDRHAPIGFHTADHGPADGSPLRPWAADRLADAGLDRAGADGPIRLLCMPRTFGLGFDPITVWFLHDADGSPSAVIHEVRNTFGDRHAYVAPVVDPGRTPWRQSIPKTMHVSPFFDRDGRYDFRIVPPSSTPGSSVSIRIDYRNDDGLLLTAVEVVQMEVVPEIVFLSCCHLGSVNNPHSQPNKLAYSLSRKLIEMGVRCVVAAGWAVNDDAACTFASTFLDRKSTRLNSSH